MTRINASIRPIELSNAMLFAEIPPHLFNDWQETEEARELLKERINQRLLESKKPIRFYNRVVTLEEALIK